MSTISPPEGVEIIAEVPPAAAEILTNEAIALVAKLHREFEPRRRDLERNSGFVRTVYAS